MGDAIAGPPARPAPGAPAGRSAGLQGQAGRGGVAEVVVHADDLAAPAGQQ
jgi:hypothetical protein